MRIQVLSLPSQRVGELEQWPFALVVDQHESRPVDAAWPDGETLRAFAKQCGAEAVLITDETVEVL